MAGLRKTTADLVRYRRQFESFLAAAKQTSAQQGPAPASAALREITHFGAYLGQNRWADFDVVFVVGREQIPHRR